MRSEQGNTYSTSVLHRHLGNLRDFPSVYSLSPGLICTVYVLPTYSITRVYKSLCHCNTCIVGLFLVVLSPHEKRYFAPTTIMKIADLENYLERNPSDVTTWLMLTDAIQQSFSKSDKTIRTSAAIKGMLYLP